MDMAAEGKSYLKQRTLGDLEASLDSRHFVRIHRSCLLNIDRLARIDTEGSPGRWCSTTGRACP
jgi:two-component system LytT family response regulator